jgi:uncharacterized protein (DUF1778 family)
MTAKARAPKRRKAVRKEDQIHLRVTSEQKAELTAAAAHAGVGVSSWILLVSLQKARDSADRGGGT